jgi:hypothetical protein
VAVPTTGTYYLQVQTVTKSDGTAAPTGGGANRFSVRAGIGNSYTTDFVRVFGNEKMGVYANAQANVHSQFFLARVMPGASGRSLVIDLYDIGDAPGGAIGTLTVLPPPDSNVGGPPNVNVSTKRFTGCTYTPPPGNATGPPWGTFVATPVDQCQVTNVSSANYNGQWFQIKIPIPDDYTCDTAVGTGCWTRIDFFFNGIDNDTTTWKAHIEGDPVRIVE